MMQPKATTMTVMMHSNRLTTRNFNLFLAFLLCPFVSSSVFLAPPSMNGVKSVDRVDLLDGKLLLKLNEEADEAAAFAASSEESSSVCPKVTHRNVTLLHSISKSTGRIVHVQPHSHFSVAFCEQQPAQTQLAMDDEEQQCAVGASCASVYGWATAMVRQPHPRLHSVYVADKVLVPVNCLCVLGWADTFGALNEPVILE